MEQQNPYQSPQSVVADVTSGPELAGRGARLGAAILDGVIAAVVIMPIMFFGGYFTAATQAAMAGEQLGYGVQFVWGLLGLVVFFAIQFVPLKQSGQTWGKKIVGVRIIALDGTQPGIGVLLGRRYLFSNGVALVPMIGWVLSLVNILFIFRGDKRCLHDLVAGTQVVRK